MAGEYGGIILFAAKCAPGLRLNDANFVFGQIENRAQSLEDVIGTLQRSPNRDAAFRAVLRNHALVFDVEMFLRSRAIFALHDMRGVSPN